MRDKYVTIPRLPSPAVWGLFSKIRVFPFWRIIFYPKHKVEYIELLKICQFKWDYDKVEIQMFWSLQVTRDALCCCKKSLCFSRKTCLQGQTDELQKMPSTPDITYTYFSFQSRSFWQLARESPVFISMNAVWKGSKFQKSPPVSAWFMSSTFSQSLTKNIRLHFSIFPKFFHHWTFSTSNAGCENCANWRKREKLFI